MREPTMESGAPLSVSPPPQALLERLKDYGQEDAFALWDELSSDEKHLLVNDIENIDLPRIDRIIRCSFHSQGLPAAAIEPVPESCVSTVDERTMEDREKWWKMGMKAIAEGKLGVLLLSGGQGTRLGSSDPKGCFNIGLPSGKSLFHLQAERILCIQRLAAITANEGAGIVPIQWYIMTSPFTDEATRKYFESHKYFGLEADQVTFFQQGTIPCVSKDGRFIMETPYRVAKSPDGNGGVYTALKSSRLLEDMNSRGIKFVDCYGVDNALVRVADPTFLGYFIDKGVSAAAKVVRKAYPQEKVGVFVRRGKGGPLAVVEYSELDPSLSSAVNQETGRLRFCWSNVCLHMFTVDFLNQVANGLEKDSIYHLAEKKISSIHGQTVGYKLEQFIFDAFPYTPSTTLFEVAREEEFAPVKNANGANFDTPDSARLLVLRLHTRWVVAAGGFLTHSVPLYATGHVLTEEQQVQSVIRFLPQSWENMKMHLTHNVNIKTMKDAKRHLELEEERLGVDSATTNASMTSFGPQHGHGKKRKYGIFFQKKRKEKVSKKPKLDQQGEENIPAPKKKKKVNMAKLKCYNCEKKGHFASDCPKLKKTQQPPNI